jgi:hypothetical protein
MFFMGFFGSGKKKDAVEHNDTQEIKNSQDLSGQNMSNPFSTSGQPSMIGGQTNMQGQTNMGGNPFDQNNNFGQQPPQQNFGSVPPPLNQGQTNMEGNPFDQNNSFGQQPQMGQQDFGGGQNMNQMSQQMGQEQQMGGNPFDQNVGQSPSQQMGNQQSISQFPANNLNINSADKFSQDSEHIQELIDETVEKVIEERWDLLTKNVEKVVKWKGSVEQEVNMLKEEIVQIKRGFENLEKKIVSKINSYDTNIMDVNSEIKALEKVFQKITPTLINNVNELSKIADKIKTDSDKKSRDSDDNDYKTVE